MICETKRKVLTSRFQWETIISFGIHDGSWHVIYQLEIEDVVWKQGCYHAILSLLNSKELKIYEIQDLWKQGKGKNVTKKCHIENVKSGCLGNQFPYISFASVKLQ